MAVGIRPWRPGDAPVIVEALNDPGVTDNLRDGLPKPYTEADALKYIIASQEEGAYAFAITEDGAAVGSIQLSRQGNIHSRTAEPVSYTHLDVYKRQELLRYFLAPAAVSAAAARLRRLCGVEALHILVRPVGEAPG